MYFSSSLVKIHHCRWYLKAGTKQLLFYLKFQFTTFLIFNAFTFYHVFLLSFLLWLYVSNHDFWTQQWRLYSMLQIYRRLKLVQMIRLCCHCRWRLSLFRMKKRSLQHRLPCVDGAGEGYSWWNCAVCGHRQLKNSSIVSLLIEFLVSSNNMLQPLLPILIGNNFL